MNIAQAIKLMIAHSYPNSALAQYTAAIITLGADCGYSQISDVKLSGNTVNQLVQNGNFVNGTTGWVGVGSTLSASNNVLTNTGDGTNVNPYIIQTIINASALSKKIYVTAKIKVTNALCARVAINIELRNSGAYVSSTQIVAQLTPTSGTLYTLSAVHTLPASGFNEVKVGVIHVYADAATANGKVMDVKVVMVIDMGTSGELYNLTADQMNTRFPTWLKYGTVSTLSGRVKSLKNLANWDNKVIGAEYNNGVATPSQITSYSYDSSTYTVTFTSSSFRGIGFKFKVKPNQSYYAKMVSVSFVNKRNSILWYDSNGNYISATNTTNTEYITGTSPQNSSYAIVVFTSNATGTYSFKNLMINEGSTALPFEPYTETTFYTPADIVLRSLPNGVKDEFRGDGTKIQNVSDNFILTGSENWQQSSLVVDGYASFFINNTGLPVTAINPANYNTNLLRIGTYTEWTSLVADEFIEVITGYTSLGIRIKATRLASADVAGFKAWLTANPITLNYQLSTPIVTQLPIRCFRNGVLSNWLYAAGPNTTIIQEAVASKEAYPVGGQITLPTTNTLTQLVACYRHNGGTSWDDVLSSASINLGTGVVTITGADDTKAYFVAATVDPSKSTLGTLKIKYPKLV